MFLWLGPAQHLIHLKLNMPVIRSEMKNKWIKIDADSELEYQMLQQIFQQEGGFTTKVSYSRKRRNISLCSPQTLKSNKFKIFRIFKIRTILKLNLYNSFKGETLGIMFRFPFSKRSCSGLQIFQNVFRSLRSWECKYNLRSTGGVNDLNCITAAKDSSTRLQHATLG